MANLGASCFINAGLQALLALPDLELAGETETERALKAVADMAQNSTGTFTPKPLTDRFYNRRQEDCSEFLLNLLLECPGASQQFKGIEEPFLQCTCCDYQYALRPETFLSLQASLQDVQPLRCMQSVLDHYVNKELIQDDIIDWVCLSEACLNAGTATNAPRRKTRITAWPRTLMVTLKRWTNSGLLDHPVCCNRQLVVGDCRYFLKAVVTHIGATASSGHYIAYRPNNMGFEKYDDSRLSQVTNCGDYIVSSSEEKVYLLMYSQIPAPTSPRLPPVKRPAVDLDDSETEDSTPTEPWPPRPKSGITTIDLSDDEPKAAAQEDAITENNEDTKNEGNESGSKAKTRLQNFHNYSEEERAFIVYALGKSDSLAEAMKMIAGELKNFTTKTKQSEYFLHRSTLQNWFKNPQFAQKALHTAAQAAAPKPQRPYSRKPARASLFANLTPEKKTRLGEALAAGGNLDAVAEAPREESSEQAVPPTTLSRWNSSDNFRQWVTSAPSWSEEYNRNFGVMMLVPKQRPARPSASENPSSLWLQKGSWTFCELCGHRQPRTKTQRWSLTNLFPRNPCRPCCSQAAQALLAPPPKDLPSTHFRIYPVPQGSEWHSWSAAIGKQHLPLTEVLAKVELENLAVVRIHVDYRSRRGGNAEITSKQKRSLTRCRWAPASLLKAHRGDLAARAFTWLLQNNDSYRAWIHQHAALIQENKLQDSRDLPTAELLLRSPGIEVAARPWLYPLPSMADTNIQERLLPLGWTHARSKPSIRASFMHKVLSRCADYSKDFPLQCLLYDICMARTISAVQAIAEQNKMSPEKVASDMDTFEEYWHQQLRKMEDICRVEFERTASMDAALPSVFFTVAPAEWRYLLHEGLFEEGSLADQQQKITLHLYHTLQTLLEFHIFKDGESLKRIGVAKVRQWSFRFEFQSRGTLHLHAVLWADLLPGSAESMSGRSGTEKSSEFVRLLEELFSSRADVQAGDGTHNLLRYVAGYVSKASDALQFSREQAHRAGTPTDTSKWRQTYRLLCKKSPMEQEMVMEFAGLPMVRHSFSGHAIYAPIPGSAARNSSRNQYLVYQHYLKEQKDGLGNTRDLSYMEWLRRYRVVDANEHTVAKRNLAGPATGCDCGVAMTFPFELLDIFIGAWAATFLKEMPEYRLLPDTSKDKENYGASHNNERVRRSSFVAPEGCKHLKAVLSLNEFQLPNENPTEFHPDIGKLLSEIELDLILRGLGGDRIATFKARMHACTLLLLDVRNGFEDPALWSAKQISAAPSRVWSEEQQLVLEHIKAGTTISDAATMEGSNRILQVAGGPGTGKTEVVIAAVRQALEDNCRVLIAGPIGLLVSMYRLRLPNLKNLTMETVHSAFRITRQADEAYIPPGRLRQYDLIVIDEVSQIEASVWRKLRTALGELAPSPFVVFVGDFQQLQPLSGGPELESALQKQREAHSILYVELKHHQAARAVDEDMLNFLNAARIRQPTREELQTFFSGRVWPSDVATTVRTAKTIESISQKNFTFLTVTNKGAAMLNLARLRLDFPQASALLTAGGGIPTENEKIAIAPNMRMRLTHNVDKERAFVNGNAGTVRKVLRADVFLLQSDQGLPILVHPITSQGRKFLPVAYGWATTIRRAQGATLDKIGLWFDRRLSDRGYAYVGVSRAKHRNDVFLIGRIRRSDWRAVGGEGSDEQNMVSGLSESSHSSEPEDTDGTSETEDPPHADSSSSSRMPTTPTDSRSSYNQGPSSES